MTVIAISVFPLNPAIVRNINDQGIVPNASAFQTIQELPAGLVKPLAHGVVLGNEFAVHQLFVFVEQARGRRMGRMRQKGGIPDEEWLFCFWASSIKSNTGSNPSRPIFRPSSPCLPRGFGTLGSFHG